MCVQTWPFSSSLYNVSWLSRTARNGCIAWTSKFARSACIPWELQCLAARHEMLSPSHHPPKYKHKVLPHYRFQHTPINSEAGIDRLEDLSRGQILIIAIIYASTAFLLNIVLQFLICTQSRMSREVILINSSGRYIAPAPYLWCDGAMTWCFHVELEMVVSWVVCIVRASCCVVVRYQHVPELRARPPMTKKMNPRRWNLT